MSDPAISGDDISIHYSQPWTTTQEHGRVEKRNVALVVEYFNR
jgi:hypothetical protein